MMRVRRSVCPIMDSIIKLQSNQANFIVKTKKMTLMQANLCKIRDKSTLCANNFSLKIVLQVNLRLRACLAMCLKNERSQPQRAYKAHALKKKSVIHLGGEGE